MYVFVSSQRFRFSLLTRVWGTVDAKIAFPAGLTIEWNGKALGSIGMPDVDVVGDVGASFEVDATFAVADTDHLADFTKTLLTAETFDWVISGDNLSGARLDVGWLASWLAGWLCAC